MNSGENSQRSAKPQSIGTENLIGAGSGMLLAHLAQRFPDETFYKSWIITLAPFVAFIVKHFWAFCLPEAKFWMKNFRSSLARWRYERGLNKMIGNSNVTDEVRKELEQMKVHAGLLHIMNLYKNWRTLSSRGDSSKN